jgi:hypothetical protein
MELKIARFILLAAILLCWPSIASAHNLGRIAVVSYSTVVLIGSLISGLAKISILDRVGDPSRRIGKPVALTIIIELVTFSLVCAALVGADILPKSIFTLVVIICAVELPIGVLDNWFILARPAKPRLAFGVTCILSIIFPVALSLTSILIVPIVLVAIGT